MRHPPKVVPGLAARVAEFADRTGKVIGEKPLAFPRTPCLRLLPPSQSSFPQGDEPASGDNKMVDDFDVEALSRLD
jgi:hypothetical protein